MGARQKAVMRVVLDTNVVVSALLFKTALSKIIALWQRGAITPVISKDTFQELQTVLAYPKFALTRDEIRAILEGEILPFFEVIEAVCLSTPRLTLGVYPSTGSIFSPELVEGLGVYPPTRIQGLPFG